jgi:hypothetical protein
LEGGPTCGGGGGALMLFNAGWSQIETFLLNNGYLAKLVISLMRRSAPHLTSRIFLEDLEELYLPVLDAMAAGCFATGFPGWRGKRWEYAASDNGILASEDDVKTAILQLRKVLHWVLTDTPDAKNMTAAGRATAAGYSIAERDKAILNSYASLLNAK